MTPIKPIENTTRVRGVASTRYPLNKVCAHPECDRTDVTAHHIFGRFPGENGDSWFVSLVLIDDDGTETLSNPLPHVTGLCGHGTEGHHDDVEAHEGWIKYEDGEFVWYERVVHAPWADQPMEEKFSRLGPLNPQPGSVEGKPKRRRFKSEAARKRTTKSIRVPNDADEGGVVLLEENIELLEEKLNPGNHRPPYYTLMDALAFTIHNAGPEDL